MTVSTEENPNGDILDSDFGMYTNLHHHSIYSCLDGFSKLESAIIRCKKMGMKGFICTEHGNMMSAYEQFNLCKKHGIKPIYANEMYISHGSALVKEKVEGVKANYHLIVIAYNDIGYQNLMKLTSDSWIKYKYYKPRIDLAALAKHSEGLIVTQACIGGLIAQLFLDGKLEEAEDTAVKFHKIMEGRYYLEMQYTGIEEQLKVNTFFKYLNTKHGIPLIITCDSHYTYSWESDYHAALVSINTGGKPKSKKKEEPAEGIAAVDAKDDGKDVDANKMFYTPNAYYIKPYNVLAKDFHDAQDIEAFKNTNLIAEMCNVNFKTGGKIFPMPVTDPDTALRAIVYDWHKLYTKDMDDAGKQRYADRLEHELDVVSKMQFSEYFIVVKDIIDHCDNNGIITGPGRGSAAGALLAYACGITKIDPLEYGLLFGRFLSRGRAKMPQIEFAEYPINKYLEESRK